LKYEEVELKSILDKKENVKLLSFDEGEKMLSWQSIDNLFEVETLDFYRKFYYRISGKDETFTLMCAENTLIMSQGMEWKRASKINPSEIIIGVN
jgi:hypothetical protein